MAIISDIVFIPIVIISIFTSIYMIKAKKDNKVNSIFGYSLVKILSGSMIDAGYDIDDMVLIKQVETDDIRVGNDIAFYEFYDSLDPTKNELTLITDFQNPPEITADKIQRETSIDDAINQNKDIIFHRVNAVFVDSDGTRFFQTKGVSNDYIDVRLVREDFVVGKKVKNDKILMTFLEFCSTTNGLILLVVVPTSILVFFQMVEVFDTITRNHYERKVLESKIRFDNEEVIYNKIGCNMDIVDQVYYFDISLKKKEVASFLWSHLSDEESTDEEQELLQKVKKSLVLYDESREKYWDFWRENIEEKKLEEFEKNKQKADEIYFSRNEKLTKQHIEKVKQKKVEAISKRKSNLFSVGVKNKKLVKKLKRN